MSFGDQISFLAIKIVNLIQWASLLNVHRAPYIPSNGPLST
jgi:hypothetical protein